MTNEAPKNSDDEAEKTSFSALAPPLLPDLYYPSESDEPVELVTCYLSQLEPLTISQVKDWLMLPPSAYVEEIPEADFWAPVNTEQDWYSDDEKARTTNFQALKAVCERTLTVRQVFRVGQTEIAIYLLGRQEAADRAGFQTKVIET